MINIESLTKRFGWFTAVDGVSFNVERGEVLGFLGPNGAGKSTTMKMVTGFLRPDGGRVLVGGDDITKKPVAVKSRIGYLPEGAPLYGDMTPRSFLGFIANIRGLDAKTAIARIEEAIEQVSLQSVLDKPIETLSKGFKRRVGLAQAILHDPEVLILDEPTDGLDPNQKHEVRSLIQSMSKDKAIILSTHILEEVEAVCSRAVIIAAGRILADGTPEELAARASGHNTVCIKLADDAAEAAEQALGGLEAVKSVNRAASDAGYTPLRLTPVNGQSILAPVSALVRENNWSAQELYVERGRLDEMFRELTGNANRAS